MAYHDTNCVCGDKKLQDTLICDACLTLVSGSRQLREFNDATLPTSYRRHAGIVTLATARRRKRIEEIAKRAK